MIHRPLLLVLLIAAAFVANRARAQSALVISQYVDTNTGNAPKGIELWNASGSAIDFADQRLVVNQYTNGTNFGEGTEKATVTSGTLAPGAVMVIGRESLQIHMSANHPGVIFIDASFTFNGNDALAIKLDDTIVDVFGTVGDDPGSAWEGGGVSTEDQNIQLIGGITESDADGWTNPSNRFEVVSTDPVGDGGLTGFGDAPSGTPTAVQFATAAATTPEGDSGTSTYHVSVTISNPDDTVATGATVVVTGGTADGEGDDYTFSDAPVVFSAGSSGPKTVPVTIHGDTEPDGSETIIFELEDVTGDVDASVGAPSTFELTIQNDDVPPVLINEFLADPALDDEATLEIEGDANGDGTRNSGDDEFIELLNAGTHSVNLTGYTISDDDHRHTFPSGTVLEPGQLMVVFGGGEPDLSATGVTVQTASTGGLSLNNSGDIISVRDVTGTEITSVQYGGEAGQDQALARDPNGTGAFVLHSTIESNSVPFSPGAINAVDPKEVLTISGTPGTGNDAGWRMLSAPVEGATRDGLDDDVDFEVDTGNMFYTWGGGNWQPGSGGTLLTSGRGFILYLFDDEIDPIDDELRLDLPGTPPSGNVTVSSLAVDETWHLLGNPYGQSYDLTGLALAEKGFQAVVQVWNPATQSYELKSEVGGSSVDAVAAWQGFFVQRSQAESESTQIEFDASFQTTGAGFAGKRSRSAEYRRLELRAVGLDAAGDEVARDEAATLFFHPAATNEWDVYDAAVANAPPRQTSVQLAFASEHDGEIVAKVQESRPYRPDEVIEVDLALEAENVEGDLVLEWPVWEHLPETWSLTLVDRATDTTVDLRANDRHVFQQVVHEGPRFALVVDASTSTSTAAPARPDRLMLRTPHPNPARTHVTLRYAMPEAADVQIRLYDVLGREVAVVREGREPAGTKTVKWTLPSHLASGLYIVRLDAAGQSLAQRLILTR